MSWLLFAPALLALVTLRCSNDSADEDRRDAWLNPCVEKLQIRVWRGVKASNVHRFRPEDPHVRFEARLGELGDRDLADYCDWEACLAADGYNHECFADDGGAGQRPIERCRVCTPDQPCGGSTSRTACVAAAKEPGRDTCHIGLLQDCLIQRAIRGFSDPRVSETCERSARACAGDMPGDLATDGQFAAHETEQIAVERAIVEVRFSAARRDAGADAGDAGNAPVTEIEEKLATWTGGFARDAFDGGAL